MVTLPMESYAQLVGWQYVLLPIDMRLSAYSWVVKFHVLNVSKLATTIVFPFLKKHHVVIGVILAFTEIIFKISPLVTVCHSENWSIHKSNYEWKWSCNNWAKLTRKVWLKIIMAFSNGIKVASPKMMLGTSQIFGFVQHFCFHGL